MNGHRCGRCGVKVHSVVFPNGLRGHVHWTPRGKYAFVPQLPGLRGQALPHVDEIGSLRRYAEHACRAPVPAFSASSFQRKVRA